MCCRYYFSDTPADARVKKILSMMERDHPGTYKTGEIFPGDSAPAMIQAGPGRLRAVPAVFGLTGFQKNKLILNARAETAAGKPTFAEALRLRRMILPADGFYEWTHDGSKTKYLFTLEGDRTLFLCGLYEHTEDGGYRFAILTRPANASVADVHDRMPVIASADEVRPYLTDLDAAMRILSEANPLLRRRPAED